MAGRMRQQSDEKLKPLAAYVPKEIYDEVRELAERSRWSLSVAVGYLVEQGLLATRKGQDTLLGVADPQTGVVNMNAEHRQRRQK